MFGNDIYVYMFYRERHYNPPDVPGYFEKVVWPHYVQFFNEIKIPM